MTQTDDGTAVQGGAALPVYIKNASLPAGGGAGGVQPVSIADPVSVRGAQSYNTPGYPDYPVTVGGYTQQYNTVETVQLDSNLHLLIHDNNVGTATDAEAAAGNGTMIALTKRLRTLLDGSSVTTVTFAIAAGQSLSAAQNLAGRGLVRLHVPSGWTAANITLQVSADGSTYYDLYTAAGAECTITAAASRAFALNLDELGAMQYVKLRSGTAAAAVNQVSSVNLVATVRAVR